MPSKFGVSPKDLYLTRALIIIINFFYFTDQDMLSQPLPREEFFHPGYRSYFDSNFLRNLNFDGYWSRAGRCHEEDYQFATTFRSAKSSVFRF